MIGDHFLFSLNNLKNKRLRSWLTMIGIFIGIAAVVSLISLGEGLRVAVTSQFGFLGTDILSVQASGIDFAGPPGTAVGQPLSKDLADKISRISGIDTAFNRYLESITLEFNDHQDIGIAASVPGGDDRRAFYQMINLEAEHGRLLRDGDGKKVMLGKNFADDDVFGRAVEAGDRVLINEQSYDVVGILKKKGNFILDSGVFLNEAEMIKSIIADDNEVNIIAVKVKDPQMIDAITDNIERLMRKERNVREGEEDFNVQSPQAILESLDETLFAVQLFIYVIALVSLVVGGIGIMNTMYTSVVERTKEIGIMKSIGAKNSTIFSIFFIESGLLGLVGGIIGIILGLIMAFGASFLGRLALGTDLIQAQASVLLIVGSLLFSFVVGTVFGVLPALQASKLQPVDSLRK